MQRRQDFHRPTHQGAQQASGEASPLDQTTAYKKKAPANVVGQTITTYSRLAAARELNQVWGESAGTVGRSPADMALSMIGGLSLANMQGPIPEISDVTPEWLAVYEAAAAHPVAAAGSNGSSTTTKRAQVSAATSVRRLRPSPYSAQLRAFDDGSRAANLAPAFPAVSFDAVYGRDGKVC